MFSNRGCLFVKIDDFELEFSFHLKSMKLRIFVYILVYILLNVFSGYSISSDNLKKIVFVDASSGISLPFVIMKSGNEIYRADENGVCNVILKDRNKIFETQLLGYKSRKITMKEILDTPVVKISLHQDEIQLEEIVIAASKNLQREGIITQKVSERLQETVGGTLVNVLEGVRGVSFISNGTTAVKPVIQGMYGNRILLVNNGVNHAGQQWGDEHSPEIDWNSARSISVIKGLQTVKYGPDALGGTLLLQSGTLPYGERVLHGNTSCIYGTDGKRYGLNMGMEGALPFFPKIAYRLQGSYLNSGDRACPKYLLNNTGTRRLGIQTTWGYKGNGMTAEVGYGFFKSDEGILYVAQRGDVELFKERVEIGRPLVVTPFSRKIDYPYHRVIHHTFSLNTEFGIAGGKAVLHYDFQNDRREEVQDRRNNLSRFPSLGIGLMNHRGKLDWERHYSDLWRTEVGGEVAFASNTNISGTGVVPVIPNYTEQRLGVFLIQRLEREKWGLEAGTRFDRVANVADGYDAYGERYGGKKFFVGWSVIAGGYWRVGKRLKYVLNWGLAWRPPHVHELYSKGVEHASGIYLIGNTDMKTENVQKVDVSCEYVLKKMTLTVEGYMHWFGRYIYDEPSGEFKTEISGTYPVFQYRQVNAFFRGIDVSCSFRWTKWMEYTLSAGMLWANETESGRFLPYIPPFRLGESLNFYYKKGRLELKHRYVGKQTRFDPQTDLVPFSPPAYHWLGLSASMKICCLKGHKVQLGCEIANLLNTEYKEYTNRFRYYAHEAGRDVKWMIIWNF